MSCPYAGGVGARGVVAARRLFRPCVFDVQKNNIYGSFPEAISGIMLELRALAEVIHRSSRER